MKIKTRPNRGNAMAGCAKATAILAGGMMFCGSVNAEQVFSENFDELALIKNNPMYTDIIPGWTRDNSGMLGPSDNPAYNGGAVLLLGESDESTPNSWIAEQGVQLGRNSVMQGSGNALVFDADAWDDDPGGPDNGFNSFWSTDIDLTGIVTENLRVSFDYEFASYSDSWFLAQVSFDGGVTFDDLVSINPMGSAESVIFGGQDNVFTEGLDFDVTSDTLTLRFGLINGGNDWWAAVDNVQVNAIPEPGSAGLLGLGLVGAIAARRRKT